MSYSRNRLDIQQTVTDKLVAAIEDSDGKVTLPWHRPGLSSVLPKNALTENHYNGINILMLWAEAQIANYPTSLWATYKQWEQLGAQVRKGSKGSLVVFYKSYEVEPNGDDADDDGMRRVARASWVFNVDQVDNFTNPQIPDRPLVEKLAHAEDFLAQLGVPLRTGGDQAFYCPVRSDGSGDFIQMPDERLFDGASQAERTENWYSVALHEATHATGDERRCNRQMGKRFGDDLYCAEEAVAEIGSAMAMAYLGLSPQPRADHAHYIRHWLDVMKADKSAIFVAAARASEALNWMIARQPQGA